MNILGEGWTFIVLLVAMPKLVSCLGPTAFGLFSLAWVVIGYLTFLDVGVNRAATKFVSEYLATRNEDAIRTVVATAVVTNLILGLLGAFLIALTAPYLIDSVFTISPDLRHEARLSFYAMALAVPVLLTQGIFRGVLSSYQRFGWINGVNSVATTTQWALAAMLAWRHFGVALVVLSTVIVRLLATVVYGIVLFSLVPAMEFFKSHCFRTSVKLVRFGSWVTVSQLVSPVLVYLDRALIASFSSLAAVTLYTVPYEMMTRLRVVPSSMMGTLYPAFSERGLVGQNGELQHLYERSVRYLLLVLLPGILFLVVLGPDALTLWMGRSFELQTSTVLQTLAVGVLANGVAYIPYNMLQAVGRPELTGKFHLLELPVYVALCFLLIPYWGINGAALASTLRFFLDAALLFWAARKYCGCSLRTFSLHTSHGTTTLSLIFTAVLLGVRIAVPTPWMRVGLGALCTVGFFVAAYIFILDPRERPALTAAIKIFRSQPAS